MDSAASTAPRPWWKTLFFGDFEPSFENHCLVVACRFMVFYPALIVFSFPGCRIWAILTILFWLGSGHWKERFELIRSNLFLSLAVAYLALAFLGIFYSAAPLDDRIREWHGRQTLLIFPVLVTLLYQCPERRPQMFAVYNLSIIVAFAIFLLLFFAGNDSWELYVRTGGIYFFKNYIGTGISLVLWAGLWICYPFSSREIPWIRQRLSLKTLEAISAASRLRPWTICVDVFARRLPWQSLVWSLLRWGVIGSVAAYLFLANPSRTSQLTMLVSCAGLLLLWNWRNGLVYLLVTAALLIPLVYSTSSSFEKRVDAGIADARFFLASVLQGRSGELLHNTEYRAVADGRLLNYRQLAAKTREKPLFGFGMGVMDSICRTVSTMPLTNPHNEYLCIAIQSGWVGLMLYLALLGAGLIGAFRKTTPWKQLGVFVLLTLIVDGCFNCALSYSSASRFYGILLATVFVADLKRKRLPERRSAATSPTFFRAVQGPDALIRKLDFIREVDKLKQILRRNYVLGGLRRENDAEHSWHIALMSVLFADDAAASGIDRLRVLKMLLVHDLVEIDAGDTYAFDVRGNADKAKREQAAADRIFRILPEKNAVELRQLWDEFEAGETPDSKFAAAMDRLQPMLQNYLYEGAVWRRNGISPEQVASRLGPVREAVPELGKVADAIIVDAVNRGYFVETATFAVIIVAAGQSRRFGDATQKKPFIPLAGLPVWQHSAERFAARSDVRQLIVVVAADDERWFREQYAEPIQRLGIEIVCGGQERFQSVQNALDTVRNDIDFVAVHDAARPGVFETEIDSVFAAARKNGAAMLASPIVGTVKRIDATKIVETVPREKVWEAQTPQVFERQLLIEAYAERFGQPTDDAQLVEQLGREVVVVPGDRRNLKITTRADFEYLERILTASSSDSANTFS